MLSDAEYTRLAEQYLDMVFRVAIGYVKSGADADDVAQSVFLRLWKRRPEFDSEAHAMRWLIRVAINESKRLLCSPWRNAAPLEEQEERAAEPESHRELIDALDRLKPKYRTALYLYYYEGFSTKEIAETLSVPQNTVLTRLKRARELLKQELTEAES